VELLVDTYIAIRIVAPSPGPHRHRHRRRPPALSAQRIAIAIYPGPEKKSSPSRPTTAALGGERT